MSRVSRREFAFRLAAGFGAATLAADLPLAARHLEAAYPGPARTAGKKRPLIVSSANGYTFGATRVAYEKLAGGADTLDAAIAGVNMNELDMNELSVGFHALPNEDGVVQLDASCMHGPTMQCGAVGAIERVKTPSSVAKAVMDNTDDIFLVGAGATKFAEDMGFEMAPESVTDRARKIWMLWRETRSLRDSWGAGLDSPNYDKMLEQKENGPNLRALLQRKAASLRIAEEDREFAMNAVLYPPHGTINLHAVNEKGEISAVTTTSGLAWKVAGRCGDSPIIGAGCYVDGEVGAAGSTGRGEENIRVAGAHTVVEMMRQGKTPTEACLEALRRVQRNFRAYPDRLKKVDLSYYAASVDGSYGAASLWGPRPPSNHAPQFAVNDGVNRLENMAYLLEWNG